MRLSSYFLLAVALLLFAVKLNAQQKRNRVIATDYNECLVGVKDTFGQWIVPAKYTSIDYNYYTKGMFVVWQYTKCGLVDSNGVAVLPVMYDEITGSDSKGFYIVKNDDRKGVVNNHRDTIVPIVYKSVLATTDSVFFARVKKRNWDMYTAQGVKHKVPYKNRYSPRKVGTRLYSAHKRILLGKDKFALINDSAHTILPPEWDAVSLTNNQLIYLQDGDKYGYINYAGATVWPVTLQRRIPPYMTEMYGRHAADHLSSTNIFFRDTIAPAWRESKCGLITASGRTVLPFEYDSIGTYGTGFRGHTIPSTT